jgi:outer membrane lipoprotein carrier protein
MLTLSAFVALEAFAAQQTAAPGAPTAATQPGDAPTVALESTPLGPYLDNLKTLRTSFLQTLADPKGREIDRATGTLLVSRPGKFSWDIHPQPPNGTAPTGAGQLMVCDGRNLWFYDRDLSQVTVKPVDAALSATPAMLLSGTVDVRRNFNFTAAGERDGLTWVLVEPKAPASADFRSALFGFDRGDLKRMILEDKLDQTATVVFEKIARNAPVSSAEVSFTPPKDADVIGTPRK